jgi:hypothetical protein
MELINNPFTKLEKALIRNKNAKGIEKNTPFVK